MAATLTETTSDVVRASRLTHRFKVLSGPHAPRAARHILAGLSWVPPRLLDTAALLLTELVTNSVRHAGAGRHDRIEIFVEWAGGRLRVEVIDGGGGFALPSRPLARFPEPGGMGLVLVDRLADRWSTEREPRVRVWFVLG